MRGNQLILLSLFVLILHACSSGTKMLEKGDYDNAFYTAVKRLKSNPTHAKAKHTLTASYDLAVQNHLRKIEQAKLAITPFKWDEVVYNYEDLNNIGASLESCPSCMNTVGRPRFYDTELNDARYKAAEERYVAANKLMLERNRESAKVAYRYYELADYFIPKYKDVRTKLDEAYYAAAIKVVVYPVQVNSNLYKLSNDYFQSQLDGFMANYETKNFVMFFRPEDAKRQKVQADHLMYLSFDDFVVGQTYVKERVEEIKKENVLVGYTDQKRPVYSTVKARLSIFDKSISSGGLLDMSIIDARTNRPLHQQKMPGTFVWQDSWAAYTGDERALSKEQLAMCRKKEVMPPPPQTLFLEFTKPIYSQTVNAINGFYNRY